MTQVPISPIDEAAPPPGAPSPYAELSSGSRLFPFRWVLTAAVQAIMLVSGVVLLLARGLNGLQESALFNATADLVGSVVCLILVVGIVLDLFSADIDRESTEAFGLLVFCESVALFFDEYTQVVNGIVSLALWNGVSNVLFYSSGAAVGLMWWLYVMTRCSFKRPWFKIATELFVFAAVVVVVLSLVSFLGYPAFFTIEQTGWYAGSSGRALCGALALGMLGASVVALRCQQGALGLRARIALFISLAIPVCASVAQALTPGYSFIFPSAFVALLLVYVNEYAERGRILARKEKELARQRTDVLLSQIQPHFLYNSLTAIMGIEGNPPKTIEALAGFSRYLRGNLDTLNAGPLIPFSYEMTHLESYLELEKLRFGERLKIEFDIQARDFMLPPLTVQILAENAVKHGITSRDEGGTLMVITRETDAGVEITVADDGVGFDVEQALSLGEGHVGLRSVIGRVEDSCGGFVRIESSAVLGTRVTVTIPGQASGILRFGKKRQVDAASRKSENAVQMRTGE